MWGSLRLSPIKSRIHGLGTRLIIFHGPIPLFHFFVHSVPFKIIHHLLVTSATVTMAKDTTAETSNAGARHRNTSFQSEKRRFTSKELSKYNQRHNAHVAYRGKVNEQYIKQSCVPRHVGARGGPADHPPSSPIAAASRCGTS